MILIRTEVSYNYFHARYIEAVQDIVEQVLISANHRETARVSIVYREQHNKLRQDMRTLVTVSSSVNECLDGIRNCLTGH